MPSLYAWRNENFWVTIFQTGEPEIYWRNITCPSSLSGKVLNVNQNPDARSSGKRLLHNRLTMTTLIQTSSAAIKGKKTKDEMEGDSKNDWLEMSWAHILMGIWTPRCCCWKASATILASPSCSYWANQTQFSPALDYCPTKAAAGEREMEFLSRTTGWLNGKRRPRSRQHGATAKHHLAPTPRWRQSQLQGVLGRVKSSLATTSLQRASRHILAGWAWQKYSSHSPYINCTVITLCRANKAIGSGTFI